MGLSCLVSLGYNGFHKKLLIERLLIKFFRATLGNLLGVWLFYSDSSELVI